jgi:hypothetical protein
MTKGEFVVETADARSIRVRHLRTGARFSFVIAWRKVDGSVSGEPNPLDSTLRSRARSFAKIEARARGLID